MSEITIKRMEITVETYTRTVIKTRGGRIDSAFCQACGQNAPILTVAETASVFSGRIEMMDALTNAGLVHMVAGNAICAVSLANYLDRKNMLSSFKHEGEEKC